MQNRFKSKVLWVSIVSQILALLIALDVIDLAVSDAIKALVVSVCELLVTFGILNNPTTPERL
ncbi:MAG: holin [Clostridia bacterium]|nr:holin [Clostridia bacterium]